MDIDDVLQAVGAGLGAMRNWLLRIEEILIDHETRLDDIENMISRIKEK
jgi:hypothetical protein